MYKNISLVLSFLLLAVASLGASNQNYRNSTSSKEVFCSKELKSCFAKIQQIPEARELIENIQNDGPISIIAKNTSLSNQFGAYWDREDRMICIALSKDTDEASIIGSILFELHNASVDGKFDELDELATRGQITKAKYVESMEYLEYVNSINTAKLAEKGIAMKVIPRGARLPTYDSFKEHFAAQLRSGHSDCFGQIYDSISPRYRYR